MVYSSLQGALHGEQCAASRAQPRGLGSTSLTTDENGEVVAEQRYHPYGEVRPVLDQRDRVGEWGAASEAERGFTYTGQRSDPYIDIIHMGARWYNSRTGRWSSADSIIPGFG